MSIYVRAVQWLRSCAFASAQREETCGFNPAGSHQRRGKEREGGKGRGVMTAHDVIHCKCERVRVNKP